MAAFPVHLSEMFTREVTSFKSETMVGVIHKFCFLVKSTMKLRIAPGEYWCQWHTRMLTGCGRGESSATDRISLVGLRTAWK